MTHGVMLADSPPAADDPAEVASRAAALVAAGVQILRAGTAADVRACRTALGRDRARKVWGTIRPTGRILALQEIEEAELCASFAERAAELAGAGCDALLIQSMLDAEEAVLGLRAARQACDLAVGVCLIYGSGADQTETVMRQHCDEVTQRLQDEGADLVGCDCGVGIDEMVLLVRLMRQTTDLPIAAFPDAGQRELDGDRPVYPETAEDFGSKVPSLVAAGATVIGGCCGVTVAHLEAVAAVLAAPP